MTRNLKALGLALVAVFAMSAVAASGAQAAAAHFTAGDGNPAHNSFFTAEQDPTAPVQEFNVTGGGTECDMVSAKGSGANTSTDITAGSVKYYGDGKAGETNEPECTAFGLGSEVNFNGCEYTFHAGNYGAANSETSTGTADIVCPAGQEIEIIVAGGGLCDVDVPPQNGVNNIHYQTTHTSGKPEEITVMATSDNIEYTETGAFCAEPGVVQNNGEYEGKATVKAFSDSAHTTQVNATITST